MTFNQLEYFLDVARTLNISSVAKARFVSQPAISKQIALLENELGFKLFERGANNHLSLTNAGLELSEWLSSISHQFVEKCQQLRNSTIVNPVRVVTMNSVIFCNHLIECLLRGKSRIPFEYTIDCNQNLKSGNDYADLLINYANNIPEDYAIIGVIGASYDYIAFSRNDPLAGRHNITPQDFANKTLYTVAPAGVKRPNNDYKQVLTQLNLAPRVSTVNDATSLIIAIIKHNGFCILDDFCREKNSPSFSIYPCHTKRDILLACRKEAPEHIAQAADTLYEVLSDFFQYDHTLA